MKKTYNVKPLDSATENLRELVKEFRKELNRLNNKVSSDNLCPDDISSEISGYFQNNKQVLGLFVEESMIGFSVLKSEENVYWLDWMYILESYRGCDGASVLFDHSENMAIAGGGSQLYVWVHPHNKRMIRFLAKKGYNLMNLMEVTKGNTNRDICSTENVINVLGCEMQVRAIKTN